LTFGKNWASRLVAGISVLFGLLFTQCTQAQVGLSTFFLHLAIPPGGTAIDTLTIVNSSDVPQTVTIEPVDWVPIGPGAQKYLAPGTLERSVASWMSFWPPQATIEPGGQLEVQVELTAPPTAEGSYWGMLFVKLGGLSGAGDTGEGSRVGMEVILGVAIYAECGGGEPRGRIAGFSLTPDPVRQYRFTIEFENTGIRRLRPTGKVDILDANGEPVRELTFPKFVSLPGTVQKIEVPLTRPPGEALRPGDTPFEGDPQLPPGTYLAIAIIDYGGEALVGAQLPFQIEEEDTG